QQVKERGLGARPSGCELPGASLVAPRLVGLPRLPEMEQQNREFSSDGDDRTLLAAGAARGGQSQAEASKVSVTAGFGQDVVGALHQQPSQHRVALLGDAQLSVALAGAASSG